MFLRYLKLYLLPIDVLKKLSSKDIRITKFIKMNLSDDVDLACYALMPNHVHLLVKLKEQQGIEKLMRRALTAYAMYFNQKYKRVGTLFQSRFKAVPVLSDEYLTYITRYIHRNPLKWKSKIPTHYTSLAYFLEERQASWIKPQEILGYFNAANKTLSYKSFYEDEKQSSDLGSLTLE